MFQEINMQVTYNFFLIQVKFSTFKSSKETPGIQPGICSAQYLLLICFDLFTMVCLTTDTGICVILCLFLI